MIEHLQVDKQSLVRVHELPRGVSKSTARKAGVENCPAPPLIWQTTQHQRHLTLD